MFEILFDPDSYIFWLIVIGLIAIAIGIISRPFSTYVKFVYPNAKFEAIGNPYLNEKELSRVIDNKNLSDFKDALNSSKDYNVTGEAIDNIQRSLNSHLVKTIEMMRKDSSKKMGIFFDIYLEKLDMYLIKNSLKRFLEGKEIDKDIFKKALLPKTKRFIEKLNDSEREKLPDLIKEYGFKDDVLETISQEKIDYLRLDNEIDRHMIDRLRGIKVPYKCENAKRLFINRILDINNLKNILRANQLGYSPEAILGLFLGEGQEIAFWKYKELSGIESIPQIISSLDGTSYYNELKDKVDLYIIEKSVQVFESALDRVYIRLIKDISLNYYVTIGPTIKFLVNKEFEIKNLKAIAKGIGEGLSSEIIDGLLIKEVSQ